MWYGKHTDTHTRMSTPDEMTISILAGAIDEVQAEAWAALRTKTSCSKERALRAEIEDIADTHQSIHDSYAPSDACVQWLTALYSRAQAARDKVQALE